MHRRLLPSKRLLAGLRALGTTSALAAAVAFANPVFADPFPDADLDEAHHHHQTLCVACHAEQFGGERGEAIYTRAERRVQSADALLQQLTACTVMLGLDLFPEDEYHIAGYLNRHFYHFDQ